MIDRLAIWWLTRRNMLLTLKPRPTRIEFPPDMSIQEAEQLRAEWRRAYAVKH